MHPQLTDPCPKQLSYQLGTTTQAFIISLHKNDRGQMEANIMHAFSPLADSNICISLASKKKKDLVAGPFTDSDGILIVNLRSGSVCCTHLRHMR